jgi:hypothetical protein
MSDSNARPETLERRSLLATVGAVVTTGLAGCGGGDGGSDDDGNDDSDGDTEANGDTNGNDQPSGSDDSNGGGGDDCPAVPSSYTREDVPTLVSDNPVATIGVPSSGASINAGSATLRVEYAIGSVVVQSRDNPDSTVEDELSSGLTEVTDQYDLPSGARAQRAETGTSDRVDVYIPSGSDVVYVSVSAAGPENCLDGSLTTIRDEMVNSIQLA